MMPFLVRFKSVTDWKGDLTMKKVTSVLSLSALVLAAVFVYSPAPVEAIPGSQEACTETHMEGISSPTFVPVAGTVVTINNGLATRNVVVQFGADAGVQEGGVLVLAYSFDGGPFVLPRSFTDRPTGSFAALDVVSLGPGTHSIQPGVRVEGGVFAELGHRCLVAEGRTK